jgi:type I restriction enzyme S subunit
VSVRVVQLEDVCEITDGTHYTPPNSGGSFPFLTVKDMTVDGLAFKGCSYITDSEFAKAKSVGACPSSGDVLFSKDGTVGKVHVVSAEKPFAVLSSIAIIRPDQSRLDSSFLGYSLRNPRILSDAISRKTGSALQRIILGDLKEVSIPLPELPEQKGIARLMEQTERLRRIRDYAFALSETFLPAAFLELFAQELDRFQLCSVEELAAHKPGSIRTGPFGSQLLHSEFADSGIAVLGIDNAVNNRFEWAERRFITPQKYQYLKRYTVRPGDVLITIMGTCGRCAVVPDDIGTTINTKHLCCITLDHARCLPVYLQAAFLHHPFVRHQLGISQKGAIMEGLNMEIIKNLKIPLPPIAQQEHFASLALQHHRLRAGEVEALRQADHLFRSLLHRSFAEQ